LHAFCDDGRCRCGKAAAVVLNAQRQIVGAAAELHGDVAGPAVTPDVDERFLHDAHDLAADAGGKVQIGDARAVVGGDAGLAPEALYDF